MVKNAAKCLKKKINALGRFYSGSSCSLQAIETKVEESAVYVKKLLVNRNTHETKVWTGPSMKTGAQEPSHDLP